MIDYCGICIHLNENHVCKCSLSDMYNKQCPVTYVCSYYCWCGYYTNF
jgi:hypothetical protein